MKFKLTLCTLLLSLCQIAHAQPMKHRVFPGWLIWLLLCGSATCFMLRACAEIIPSTNRVDWIPGVTVGVPGGIPVYPVTTTLVPLGGGLNDATQINAALNAAPANTAVFLSPGTYILSNQITIASNFRALRGSGSNQTILQYRGSSGPVAAIYIAIDSGPQNDQPLVSGYGKGATNLVLTDASAFTVGALADVHGFSPWFVRNSGNGVRLSQLLKITAKSGNNITVWPPLYYPWTAADGPKIFWLMGSREGIGVEDLRLETYHPDIVSGINIVQGIGCWVKGVETKYLPSNHIMIDGSLFTQVEGCFMHESAASGPSSGYGIIMYGNTRTNAWNGATASLIQNNFLAQCQPGISMQLNCDGNVIAYNYVTDHRSPFPVMGWDIGVHQGHPMYNLIEGNVCGKIEFDGYHGSSSHNVVFRNWSGVTHVNSGYENQIAICVGRWNYLNYYLGNILGDARIAPADYIYDTTANAYSLTQKLLWRMGYPFTGNGSYLTNDPALPAGTCNTCRELAISTNNVRHGNYDLKQLVTTWDPSIADTNLVNSYYLIAKPIWWNANCPWPPIGPDIAGLTNAIPAQFGLACIPTTPSPPPRPAVFRRRVIWFRDSTNGAPRMARSEMVDMQTLASLILNTNAMPISVLIPSDLFAPRFPNFNGLQISSDNSVGFRWSD